MSEKSEDNRITGKEIADALGAIVSENIFKNKEKKKSPWSCVLSFLTSNWVIFTFTLSLVSILLGWCIYGISPLRPIQEIAEQQNAKRFHKRMVARHLVLGNSFLSVGNLKAAKIEYDNALKLDPNSVEAQLGKFKAELFEPIAGKDYDPEVVEKRLNLVLEENPGDVHALVFLGSIYQNIDTIYSKKYYQKAIKIDSTVAMAYFGLGNIYDMNRQYDSALLYYEKAVRFSRWNQSYLNNLAYQYFLRNQNNDAIEIYLLLLKLDYRFLLSYFTLTCAQRKVGDLSNALHNQKLLFDYINDTTVTNLDRNKGEWLFHAGKEEILLIDLDAKKYYAYRSISLTSYLLGKKTDCADYVALSESLHIQEREKSSIKKLMGFDVSELSRSDSAYKKALNEYSFKFLN